MSVLLWVLNSPSLEFDPGNFFVVVFWFFFVCFGLFCLILPFHSGIVPASLSNLESRILRFRNRPKASPLLSLELGYSNKFCPGTHLISSGVGVLGPGTHLFFGWPLPFE